MSEHRDNPFKSPQEFGESPAARWVVLRVTLGCCAFFFAIVFAIPVLAFSLFLADTITHTDDYFSKEFYLPELAVNALIMAGLAGLTLACAWIGVALFRANRRQRLVGLALLGAAPILLVIALLAE